jgi:hypothetical protein
MFCGIILHKFKLPLTHYYIYHAVLGLCVVTMVFGEERMNWTILRGSGGEWTGIFKDFHNLSGGHQNFFA